MPQSRKMSMFESCCNVGSGFVCALIVWECIIEPVFNIEKSFTENLGITLIFTSISVTRGYIWRRLFNHAGTNKK